MDYAWEKWEVKSLKAFSVGINSLTIEKRLLLPQTFASAVLVAGMLFPQCFDG